MCAAFFREDAGLIEERSLHLFSALEARATDALDELRLCRAKLQELETRLADAEAARQELEASRLELMEENRELDEQNRELEEDNTRLRERLRKGEPAPVFPGAARRAQGLAALMGQRPREDAPQEDSAGEPPAPGSEERGQVEPPVGTSQGGVGAMRSPFAASSRQTAEPAGQPQMRHAPQDKPEQQAQVSPAGHDERQGRLAIEQAPSADALLKQWYQRYPKTFFKGHTRPLKVGIHHDLAAREPWPEKLVRRALAGYVNLPRYLKAVREGAERIDLDGQPAGSVDTQAAEHAKRKLERLQDERRERGRVAGATPKRDGKGDDQGDGKARRGRRIDTQPRQTEQGTRPPARGAKPSTTANQADPEARLEAKLSALLAKHNGQAKGH
jgi:ProP effector